MVDFAVIAVAAIAAACFSRGDKAFGFWVLAVVAIIGVFLR